MRVLASIFTLVTAIVLIAAACGGMARPLGGPPEGSREIPQTVDVSEMSKTKYASGLILVQESEDGSCTIISYNDGFNVLGRFLTIEGQEYGCTAFSYAEDYLTRVGEVADGDGSRVVIQTVGSREVVDVTPKGANAWSPVIGPHERVYFSFHDDQSRAGSVNIDGMDFTVVEDVDNPAFLGDRLVEGRFASRTVANYSGTLAVEYVDNLSYRIGRINSSGEIKSGKTVTLEKELMFLEWIEGNQFLAIDEAQRLYVSTVDAAAPAIVSEELIDFSQEPLFVGVGISKLAVCRGGVYVVVSTASESLLVEISTEGTLTVMDALAQKATPLGCGY